MPKPPIIKSEEVIAFRVFRKDKSRIAPLQWQNGKKLTEPELMNFLLNHYYENPELLNK